MPRGRPKKFAPIVGQAITQDSVHTGHPAPVGCPYGCMGTINALKETNEYLRQQNQNLLDKLICLVPEAADRDHRLRLTHMTNMRPEAANGMVPLENTLPDEEVGLNMFMNDIERMSFRKRG